MDTSSQPGEAVTPAEAQQVGASLWEAWVQARATRDAVALQTLDAEPQLAADWGYICQFDCRGPDLTLTGISVIVAKQTSWPASFMATASHLTDCTVDVHPCNNTFVAVQAAPKAPWQIAMMTNRVRFRLCHDPVGACGSIQPRSRPRPGSHVTTLPQECAEYLSAIKTTGQPPAGTRLAPGFFTSDLITGNYDPASQQQAEGLTRTVTDTVDPKDPVWQFAGSYGATAVCGTVRCTDVRKATTRPLIHPMPTTHTATSQTALIPQ